MSGVGFSELLILALIGLIVLGPEKLPRVASQIGNWIGQARRMTRVMRRQLEDELDFDENLNPKSKTGSSTPRDDDTYSPAHVAESNDLSDTVDELTASSAEAKGDETEAVADAEPTPESNAEGAPDDSANNTPEDATSTKASDGTAEKKS
jgi:sec-independent protein translocase protein TatB